ncbi:MAG: SMC family ATPase, partial [Alicyclobacillus sp.]|nr:SMC family ATPase [Alicyclobacillus sp.]
RDRADTLTAYEEAVRRNAHWGRDLERRLAGRSVDAAAWRAAREALDEAEAAYGAALKASGSRQQVLDDLMQRRDRWKVLEQRRAETAALCTRLSALQSALRGNGFVQYVAREQMERVAREASLRLSALTHGRYALTLTDDGNFLMRDDHNGGVLRPVSTLSGGETFLTSLSLALALSAHIQLRGQHPLEFFFLDEGFGTLDPDLLDVVISSLERLNQPSSPGWMESGGGSPGVPGAPSGGGARLSIGLISHVPELRQRMPRRLVVEPAVPAGRGTRVTLERA